MIRINSNPSRKIAFREDTIMNKKEKKGVTKVTIVQKEYAVAERIKLHYIEP